ncbi:MAG: hypothetical protein ACRDMX_01085 [Solirubrobacteraceae bacterium]
MPQTATLRPTAAQAVGLPFPHSGRSRQWRVAQPTAQRRLQVALGLLWLTDGALQLQPFMFTRAFATQIIAPNALGQPGPVAAPIRLAAHLIEPHAALFNTIAAAIQLSIGLGLMHRRSVRVALAGSFGWALGVWWTGEGLGGLLTGAASPLTGAPGASLLYVLIGLIVWPRADSRTRHATACGLLGSRGARGVWALLWTGFAALWLAPANRAAGAVHDAITAAPSGARWLSSIQHSAAAAAAGHGPEIALGAAILSAAIALAGLSKRFRTPTLIVSIAIALIYFLIGQGMGGILTGSGTDPGSGPPLILLALAIVATPPGTAARWQPMTAAATRMRTTDRPATEGVGPTGPVPALRVVMPTRPH